MSTQLSFSIRLSAGIKSVHLCGSWNGYGSRLPLALDKSSSKAGSWKGTFRFDAAAVRSGQRYWYYYVVDGYHTISNPSKPSTVESTTGQTLNILDVPEEEEGKRASSGSSSSKSSSSKSSSSKHASHSSSHSSRHSSSSSSRHSSSSSKQASGYGSSSGYGTRLSSSTTATSSSSDRKSRHLSVDIPKGRPLSVSNIKSPKPVSPHATKNILNYGDEDMADLAEQLGAAAIVEDERTTVFASLRPSSASSLGSPVDYRSDSSSPSSSASGYSTPSSDYSTCQCERYGITRRGDRVKIDCGGAVCGYDDSDDCSSGSDAEYQASPVRRRGVVIR